jgi:hypothetical protein
MQVSVDSYTRTALILARRFDVLFRNQDNILQRKRIKFFWVVFITIFCWEWFPEVNMVSPNPLSKLIAGYLVHCTDSYWNLDFLPGPPK